MSELNLRQLPMPSPLLKAYEEAGMEHTRRYVVEAFGARYSVIVTRDPLQRVSEDGTDPRWHISVAGAGDVPPWRVLVAIAHELRPGVCFVLGLPPRSWWMNVHPHVLHLYETRDRELEDQWRVEGRGDEPT